MVNQSHKTNKHKKYQNVPRNLHNNLSNILSKCIKQSGLCCRRGLIIFCGSFFMIFMFFVLFAVTIGFYSKCCKTRLSTAAVLHKNANCRATFQACREQVFDSQKIHFKCSFKCPFFLFMSTVKGKATFSQNIEDKNYRSNYQILYVF